MAASDSTANYNLAQALTTILPMLLGTPNVAPMQSTSVASLLSQSGSSDTNAGAAGTNMRPSSSRYVSVFLAHN